MNHAAETKKINLKHATNLIFFALFHGGKIADTRVIHEHVNLTEFCFRRFDCCIDFFLIGDIKLEHQGMALVFQIFHFRGLASGYNRAIAQTKDTFGEMTTEAGRTTGDKPNGLFRDRYFAAACCHGDVSFAGVGATPFTICEDRMRFYGVYTP